MKERKVELCVVIQFTSPCAVQGVGYVGSRGSFKCMLTPGWRGGVESVSLSDGNSSGPFSRCVVTQPWPLRQCFCRCFTLLRRDCFMDTRYVELDSLGFSSLTHAINSDPLDMIYFLIRIDTVFLYLDGSILHQNNLD